MEDFANTSQNKDIIMSLIRANSTKWINYLFILFAFLLPLHKGIENIIVKVIFILFLFIPDLKTKLKLLWQNNFFKAYLAFLVYNLLVILWTPDKIYGLHYIQKYFKNFKTYYPSPNSLSPTSAKMKIFNFFYINYTKIYSIMKYRAEFIS